MTDRVSTGAPGGQQSNGQTGPVPPETTVLPFIRLVNTESDAPAEDAPLPGGPRGDDDIFDDEFHDADTVIDPTGAVDGLVLPDGDGGDGFDDTDPPPASPAALVIRAPRGPLPVKPGYTVAAVEVSHDEDGEENIDSASFLTPKKMVSEVMAVGVANFKALSPARLPKGTTHVVVNDHTGREVFRRPILQAA